MPNIGRALAPLASLALLAGLVIASGGCQQTAGPRVTIDGDAPNVALPLALDIENRSGAVIIQLDTTLDAPIVTARADHPGHTAWAAASYTVEEGRGVLRVLHSPNDAEPLMDGPSVLVVRTPVAEAVRVRNAGGAVELRGVAPASVEIESGAFGGAGGNVSIDTAGDITGSVTVSTTQGDILLRAGNGTTAALNANTTGTGAVVVTARKATWGSSSTSRTSAVGVINNGQNPVALTTQNGDITVNILPQPGVPTR